MHHQELMDLVTHDEPELVFAVVAPVGTDLGPIEAFFRDRMRLCRYDFRSIKLSNVARALNAAHLGLEVDESTDYKRISSLMTLGNTIRRRAGRGDALALYAIAQIAETRDLELGKGGPRPKPLARTVHFLNSLKHHHEVEALRRVYGPGFFLIGVNAGRDERLRFLKQRKGVELPDGEQLLARDENEEDEFGQKTRDTFALADVFVTANQPDELGRFLDMVFGAPFETPTRDEHAMFLAYAASMRSAQMGRQVGAVIMSAGGEIVATGANDAPRFGGGLQWPGPTDQRDHVRGEDSNAAAIADIVKDIVSLVETETQTVDRTTLADRIRRGTQVGDLTEFGRVVHAEMEALMACARAGVSPQGGTLYSTTFPCHNCAKHIVAAGITRVIFVEPYPKSRALRLHDDTITLDDHDTSKVRFTPFVGVAARRYFDVFSMRLGGGMPMVRKLGTKPAPWSMQGGKPRLRMSPFGYMDREQLVVDLLEADVTSLLNKVIAPGGATPP